MSVDLGIAGTDTGRVETGDGAHPGALELQIYRAEPLAEPFVRRLARLEIVERLGERARQFHDPRGLPLLRAHLPEVAARRRRRGELAADPVEPRPDHGAERQ